MPVFSVAALDRRAPQPAPGPAERSPSPLRLQLRWLLPFLCVVLWVLVHTPIAFAAPDDANDALMRMVAEQVATRPEAAASEPGLAQQVRDRASDMVLTAMNFLGVRYRRGGASDAEGFDCSGFTRFVFERSLGLVLPRRADEQASAAGLRTVKLDELKPGDLVFFNTLRRTFSHVGIYIGEGKFVHSPRTGGEVRVEDMRMSYWSQRFNGAHRVDALAAPAATADALAPGRR